MVLDRERCYSNRARFQRQPAARSTGQAQTWIDTEADLSIRKTGPITAMAGNQITYTVVVSNAGPSHADGVDIKDAVLPPGLTFVAGSSTQGACVSAICQLGELEPGKPVTMVITATVGPNVSGTVTNTAYIFSSTSDRNPANNDSTHTTIVGANTWLHVAKTDLTDPAPAGSTYLYQIVVRKHRAGDSLWRRRDGHAARRRHLRGRQPRLHLCRRQGDLPGR